MHKFKKIEIKLEPKATVKKILPDELKTKALKQALNLEKYTPAQKRFFRRYIIDLIKAIEENHPNPRNDKFSLREVQIIVNQYKEILGLLAPNMSSETIEKYANLWLKKTQKFSLSLIQRCLVDGQYTSAVQILNAYCDIERIQLDHRFKRYNIYGMQVSDNIYLSDLVLNQNEDKINKTTPAHEFIHRLFATDEYKTSTIAFYYGLKKGLYTFDEIKKYVATSKHRRGLSDAFRLFVMGKKKGWQVADIELRKVIFGKQEKVNYRAR